MRIGLLIYGSLESISGGYLYDRQLVAYLRSLGHEVEIVSLPWRTYGRHLLDNFSRQLIQKLTTSTFDILLQDELNHPSLAWLNGRIKPHLSFPIISIVHHLRQSEQHPRRWRPLYQWVETQYLNSVDGFIFNSQTTRQTVQALVKEKRPFLVAPPAGNRFSLQISQAEIIQKAQEKAPLRLLFVGNIIPRKGLHTLIQAVKQLPPGDWRLDIVGDTTAAPDYTQQWLTDRIIDIKENISIHGVVDGDRLARLFAQAHLFVLPSQYEGFGIVYLEGMTFGCPAIGTTAGAARESIQHGRNGFLIPPEDSLALAEYLHTMSVNRKLRLKLSLNAYRTSMEHPTWSQSMQQVAQFLERILSSTSG